MRQILGYTGMLLRSYGRDRSALFFGFLFPLLFMLLFGILNLGAAGQVNLSIADEAQNADSARFIQVLEGIDTLKITTGAQADETAKLHAGERDLVLVIPADFHLAPAQSGRATITLFTSSGRPEQGVIGSAIITQVVDQMTFAMTQTPPVVAIDRKEVSGHSLRYVDFLTPGILGMTIMQLGISGVAFPFVVDRQRGVIRRILATPISRRNFMAAHVLQRLVLGVLQVLVLLAVAVLVFKVEVVGSMALLLLITVLGSALFLTLGFAVTGLVATENAVPPVTQLVTLPQMFLSGVFFSRDAAPSFLRPVADVLPLTYLNDALRQVSANGAALGDIGGQMVGLVAWTVVSFFLAFRFFKLD